MNNEQNNNDESIGIKRSQSRYIVLRENIFQKLSGNALLVYLALRYVADYSMKCSSVEKKIKYLCNQAKVSRTACFTALKELEKNGLIKRVSNSGNQSTFWVAQDLNFFETINEPVQNTDTPVQNTDTPVQNTDTPVQNTDDIINNSFHQSSQLVIEEDENSSSQEPEPTPKLKPVEYPETYYDAQPIQEHLASEDESNRTFEDFWSLYPVKKDKKKAKAAWFSQQCYKQVDLILEKLARQIKEDSQFIDGYIMNPAKYIMGERWNDEIQRRKVKNKAHSFDLDSTEWASKFHEDIF